MKNKVYIIEQKKYDAFEISKKISKMLDIEDVKRVFIKPNMVIEPWKGEEDSWIATVTNISVIEGVLMCLKDKISGGGKLEIIIGDAPMARSNHSVTLKKLGIEKTIKKYEAENFSISLIDIREWYWKYVGTMCVSRKRLQGDPLGNKMVNLYSDSCFATKENKKYEAFDDIQPVSEFHNEIDNIFSVSASILDSDLFINLPKLKTHRIAGMTCAMKNLVGINCNKNCVPHNTVGSDQQGGDTFQQGDTRAKDEMKGIGGIARRILRKKNPILNYCFIPIKLIYDRIHKSENTIGYGMWYGNDTIWRSIVDLNRIILYCNKDGIMCDEQQRKYVCIADAIVSGEGEGPLHPTPKRTELLICSDSAVAVDLVASEIMGFDYTKIPSLNKALNKDTRWRLVNWDQESLEVYWKNQKITMQEINKIFKFHFIATEGWKGHIEK